MTTTDIVNLALNIGLGVISLILSIFAIWLSLRFNDSSNSALDSVKELTREIKTLVQIGLSQQDHLSNKMLDSIIEQGRFGRPNAETSISTIEVALNKRLESAEQSITNSVEKKVRELISAGSKDPTSVETGLESIRINIREFSGIVKEGITVIDSLKTFMKYPAHYLLLRAIVKSGAKSETELKKVLGKYRVPNGWNKKGISHLLENGLLTGTETEFEIPKENLQILTAWVESNSKILMQLAEVYDGGSREEQKVQEKDIVLSLNF
ncbi:MAG: hypothetical protein H7Y59_04305 [Anaerolineales bacterium]|nr:hypothetical protein [Anaerolineales bacterium]